MYDYLVVGAGLAGATFAEHAIRAGKRVLVVDRRNHIAGNCYTESMGGIDVHMYGPHLFHTDNKAIWDYVNRFSKFNNYYHHVLGDTGDQLVSLPINLSTLHTLLGISTEEEARHYFASLPKNEDESTVEGWCLANIGRELYEKIIKQYTYRQWNRHPGLLPASIVRRLPVRTEHNTNYFTDRYQGIPVNGYTALVHAMLLGSDVITSCDYASNPELRQMARKVVYTGSCDELFNYSFGHLEYRSVSLVHEIKNVAYAQVVGQINNLTMRHNHTRTIEHKHFNPTATSYTVISKEYSLESGEPYYPINNERNDTLAARYAELAEKEGYILCGRMANYRYYDMHQVIGQAMYVARKELHGY